MISRPSAGISRQKSSEKERKLAGGESFEPSMELLWRGSKRTIAD